MKKERLWRSFNFEAVVVFGSLILLWELVCRFGWLPEYLFPAPTRVVQTVFIGREEFESSFMQTLKGTLSGFFLSLCFGTSLAMIFSLSPFLKKAVLPFAVFFQTVPIIAIAPLLVIYFGFGLPTVIAASFIVSFFPIVASSLMGLESVDPGTLDLFKLYGASPWQILTKLKLPTAYPMMYSGWKVSAGLAIIGTVAGEFVAGGGLGAMIDVARTQQRIDTVFAALIILTLLGAVLILALKILHVLLQRHRPYGLYLKE